MEITKEQIKTAIQIIYDVEVLDNTIKSIELTEVRHMDDIEIKIITNKHKIKYEIATNGYYVNDIYLLEKGE